ncbi:hypothetical protein OFL98_28665, partial [Escherichia coli]|nr:hypothetical protein [Escherichia coli]
LYLVGVLEWLIVGMSNWEDEVKRAISRLDDGGFGDSSAHVYAYGAIGEGQADEALGERHSEVREPL